MRLLLIFIFFPVVLFSQILDDSTYLIYNPRTVLRFTQDDMKYSWINKKNIDTSVWGLHQYNFIHNPKKPYLNLGNLGTSANYLLFSIDSQLYNYPGFNSYTIYSLQHQDVEYYDTRSPFTSLNYVQGSKNEQYFKGTFAQNITPYWNTGLIYQRMGADKKFGSIQTKDNQTDHHGAILFTHLQTRNNRYHLLADYIYLNHKVVENGGVFTEDRANFDKNEMFDGDIERVNLYTAKSWDRRAGYQITQMFDFGYYPLPIDTTVIDTSSNDTLIKIPIANEEENPDTLPKIKLSPDYIKDSLRIQKLLSEKKKLRKFRIYHTYEKGKKINRYTDDLLDTLYYGLTTLPDSQLVTKTYENHRYEFKEQKFGFKLLGNNFRNNIPPFAFDIFYKTGILSWNSYGTLLIENKKYHSIGIEMLKSLNKTGEINAHIIGENSINGFDSTGYYYKSTLNLFKFKISNTSRKDFGTLVQRNLKGYFYRWKNEFKPEYFKTYSIAWQFRVSKKSPVSDLTLSHSEIKDFIFFDNYSYSRQDTNIINFFSFNSNIHLLFGKGRWVSENYITYFIIPDTISLRLPKMYLLNRIYFQNKIFSKKLPIQIGLDIRTISPYNANQYNPIIQQFYLQNEFALRDYTAIDFFANMRISSSLLFIKITHVNEGLFGIKGYFSSPFYPAQQRTFQIGLNWRFYD